MISWPGRGRNVRDEADILFAFREWLKAHEGRVGKLSLRADVDGPSDESAATKAFHLSPGIATAEPSIDLKRLPTGDTRSVAKRLSRVIVRGFIIFALVGAAFAWQRYADDQTKAMAQSDMAKAWNLASRWLPSVFQTETRPSSGVAVEPVPENSNQAAMQQTAAQQAAAAAPQPAPEPPQATPLAPATPAPVAPAISPELEQKFEALQNDLADMRHIVEQIASRQEEMAQDMVTLQVAQQTLTQRLSAPPQTAAAPGAPRPKKFTPAETATSSRSLPGTAPYPGAAPYSR
jgi:hypothetical protein